MSEIKKNSFFFQKSIQKWIIGFELYRFLFVPGANPAGTILHIQFVFYINTVYITVHIVHKKYIK